MKKHFINFFLLLLVFIYTSCSKNNNKAQDADKFVDSLLSIMTLDEKIGQMTLYTSGWSVTGPTLNPDYENDIKEGRCGNIFNALTVEYNTILQKMAIEETRLGIPLLFGYDVIHGYKTIFPTPLSEAFSWDLNLIEKSAHYSAMEATASGINWTFNPMVDISRDPRWGRIAEGSGEDPYLGSLIAAAKVRGYQGTDLSNSYTLAACVKHFAAYGAARAGRDYHTVDMSERVLREIYLPPYKAAIDAGVKTVMSAFNELDGIPATGSKYLMTKILRDEWGFNGFVVTDYTSINEMVFHGYAADNIHAGELALNAGIDMDMQGSVYSNYLKKLLDEGKIKIEQINKSVNRILKLKYELGLFKDPYLYLDKKRENETLFSSDLMRHALISAQKSVVLLKNENFNGQKLLPLKNPIINIALIGPLANDKLNMLGTWHAAGDETKVITILQGLKAKYPNSKINYVRGADFEGSDKSDFAKAIKIASQADIIILAIGENYTQNGEAASRSDIDLPGVQQDLVKEMIKTNKPIIAIVMAGRPLTIGLLKENIPAILFSGHLGTRTGDAIANIISGEYNPSGKLVVSFPRNVGQIPIFYNVKNTGRPFDKDNKYTSKYLDVSNDPLYPFGYGLSYSTFEYSGLQLDKSQIAFNEELTVTISIKNTGDYDGEETVQLYVQDVVGSVTRPVKELKGFKKVFLKAGEKREISFKLNSDDLRFYDANMIFTAEQGQFKVYVGGSSVDILMAEFELVRD